MPAPINLPALIEFYQTLSEQSIARFGDFYSPRAYFKDPFNEVHQLSEIEHIFRHMFTQVQAPRFHVTDSMSNADSAVLVWEFHYQLKSSTKIPQQAGLIRGVSHLRFDSLGKVSFHRDYWDSSEELYMQIPLIGWVLRQLRRRLAA